MPRMAAGVTKRSAQRFAADLLTQLREGKALHIRAGDGSHRFISIWVVVVENRAFVRSWSVKPDGWYHAFLAVRSGMIRVKL